MNVRLSLQTTRRLAGCCVGLVVVVALAGCRATGEVRELDDAASGDAGGADIGACSSSCINEGARFCRDDSTAVKCVERDGCLREQPTGCGSSERCEGGTCASDDADCSNRCFGGEDPQCNGDGAVVRCDDHDGDGCFEWGGANACGDGETCREGACEEVDCDDACSAGETTCEGDLVQTCREGPDGCLAFGAGEQCPEDQTCRDGECKAAESCEDECDANICGSAGGVQRCEDLDEDGCAELAEAESCDGDKTCSEGECVAASSCDDQCPDGETICVGERIAECDDHDGDGCVEFEEPRDCPEGGTCSDDDGSASCESGGGGGGEVVINEIFYDPLGEEVRGSGSDATSPSFLELAGPSEASVAGYKVRLVNGSNGETYGSATLPSGASLDAGGRAVLAMTNAGEYFTDRAPNLTNVYQVLEPYQSGLDALQNGADNVVLEDDSGNEIDAVGYGSFASDSAQFVGEGDPASGVSSGRSLGRTDKKDTDDNSADFTSYYPTPGIENSDLLINEVYPNQPGQDDGSETFVEIAAPIPKWENLPLDGYRLHAINGYDGEDYLPDSKDGISLFGHELHDGPPDDGYFVVCNEAAPEAPDLPWCSTRYTGGDFQNGPDNFVLRYNGKAVDAVGYGSFGDDEHFVGEGDPVDDFSSTDAGKSIGRWPLPNQFFDFDDNYLDFWKMTPTPGVKNKTP